MKKAIYTLLGAFALFFSSCSEKFEVTAPYKDVTVAYGYLDMADTAHYIRIQKAFLDENKSAVSMAKDADSSFFSDINVRIDRYRAAGTNGVHQYVDSIHLYRVDLNAEGYPKQPGTFFNAPNYAYKFLDTLTPGYIYRLKITHKSTGATDSADAPIINKWQPAFKILLLHDSYTNLAGMSFYSLKLPSRYFEFRGTYAPPTGYNYNGESTPVRVAQAIIRFNWHDSDINTKLHTPRSFDYNTEYVAVNTDNSYTFKIANRDLYNAIGSGMGAAPANTVRLIDRCDIFVYLATSDFANYRNSLIIQGNGLTGSEIAPMYTNVKGENALGLFTSRAMTSGAITITKETVDSLIASPVIKHVNLKGTVYR